tara:strand:+ start:450 stop:1085 length:636 start_codon:yes stop_codon:yes gene_type:complete
MTFYVQGLNGHESMPHTEIVKEPRVEKMQTIVPDHAIDEEEEHRNNMAKQEQRHVAAKAYKSTNDLPQTDYIVLAEQIMTSPVVTLNADATVNDVLKLFQTRNIRHFPVVSSDGVLIGIVSERDILHHLGGMTENYRPQIQKSRDEKIMQLMKSPVLTASNDTDVRYIARLFVEQRIGALPIVTDGKLNGIITRSDVLTAVMRHFVLELWT